jgi:hypothetical protein
MPGSHGISKLLDSNGNIHFYRKDLQCILITAIRNKADFSMEYWWVTLTFYFQFLCLSSTFLPNLFLNL